MRLLSEDSFLPSPLRIEGGNATHSAVKFVVFVVVGVVHFLSATFHAVSEPDV
jgi:hypothetical protein